MEIILKLGTKGRYAVMAMVDLAMYDSKKPVTLKKISERQEISLRYLEQLFLKLRRSGLVNSVRGPGGGYKLAIDPRGIHISDIISAVDEPVKVTRCETKGLLSCMSKNSRCLTHDLWDQLGHQIMLYLSSVTLADVCNRDILACDKLDKVITTEIAAE